MLLKSFVMILYLLLWLIYFINSKKYIHIKSEYITNVNNCYQLFLNLYIYIFCVINGRLFLSLSTCSIWHTPRVAIVFRKRLATKRHSGFRICLSCEPRASKRSGRRCHRRHRRVPLENLTHVLLSASFRHQLSSESHKASFHCLIRMLSESSYTNASLLHHRLLVFRHYYFRTD